MVRPVEEDARGIVEPAAGLAHFRLDRYAPGTVAGRLVDRYWVATWDLRGKEPYTQRVFAHPVVNVVITGGEATVHGVTTRIGARTLSAAGRAVGIMFRPAGFWPLLGESMSTLVNREIPLGEMPWAAAATELLASVTAAGSPAQAAAAADRLLASIVPQEPQPSEETTLIAERAAADPSLMRVADLARGAGMSVRQMQRRFSDHIGIGAKALIRRYRLYEAAERARRLHPVAWADLASELGYSDQSHLTREFTALIGMSPERYARACRESAQPGGAEAGAGEAGAVPEPRVSREAAPGRARVADERERRHQA